MARIKIRDLPESARISRDEMKKVFGGIDSESILRSMRIGGKPAIESIDSETVSGKRGKWSAKR